MKDRRRYPKVCEYCGCDFKGLARTTKYCSRACQARGIDRHVDVLSHYDVEDRGYETPCWVYRRGKRGGTNRGYSQVRLPDGSAPMVHRYFYEKLVGPIPQGLTIDHL